VGSAGVGAETDIGKVRSRMFFKMFRKTACEIFQCSFGAGGERQNMMRTLRQIFRPESCGRFLDNHVRVGAAKPETADAGETPRSARPGLRLRGNFDSCAGKRNSGIELREMDLAGNFMVLEAPEDFGEAGHA
jgi:hypothetical protein